MWVLVLCICAFILLSRHNKFLQTSFEHCNVIGIQIGSHIYGPLHDLHQKSSYWFDLVLIGKHDHHLHLYRIFHREHNVIPLTYVPVMHKLTYLEDNSEREHSYYPGSPFQVRKGDLVLYRRKKKGFAFSLEEVARSKSWPIDGTGSLCT